jgi:hypothetical protein
MTLIPPCCYATGVKGQSIAQHYARRHVKGGIKMSAKARKIDVHHHYLAWRIALSKYAGKEARPSMLRMLYDFVIAGGPVSGLNILKNMYYDTALTASPYALRAMQEFVGSSQIVFGSDLPFAEKVAPIANKDLRNYTGFSAEDFKAIDYNNCLELFPHFKS